jgi:hypothetical protein
LEDGIPRQRFDFQTFDWEEFIAASQAICAPDGQDLDWVAWAPDWDETQGGLPIEFAPLGFHLCEMANRDCEFEAGDVASFLAGQDELTRIFVPFTGYPRLASGDLLHLEFPADAYGDLACADGASWTYDEEAEMADSYGAPWPSLFNGSPTQLGYLLSREGETLLVAPALLVSELKDGGDGPFVASLYAVHLSEERLGTLRERFWQHLECFA